MRFWSKFVIFFIFVIEFPQRCQTRLVKTLHFEENNPYGNAFLEGDQTNGENFKAFSICLWLMPVANKGSAVFVYSGASKQQISLGINVEQNFVAANIADGSFLYPYLTGKLNSWFHLCIIWSKEKPLRLFVDGLDKSKSFSVENLSEAPESGGNITLGNYIPLSVSPDLFAFYGYMYDVNMWSRSLEQNEVFKLFCCSTDVEEGDVISWSSLDSKLQLSSGVEFNDFFSPCDTKSKECQNITGSKK